jgi:hypothetical protein
MLQYLAQRIRSIWISRRKESELDEEIQHSAVTFFG